ncbi:hypothetical protein JCGZ_09731 [Jatropha curcas]|uniref:Uncharacterized protein n=1 Tax=Jatropha curcas TaxID=180498 RepID=A0A067LAP5_JATCU|nr:hypothetical protein JCGZ_09731 [Jatropha curcas]
MVFHITQIIAVVAVGGRRRAGAAARRWRWREELRAVAHGGRSPLLERLEFLGSDANAGAGKKERKRKKRKERRKKKKKKKKRGEEVAVMARWCCWRCCRNGEGEGMG